VLVFERNTEETRLNIVDFAEAVDEETEAVDPDLYVKNELQEANLKPTEAEFLRANVL
jgi:hypothetical protein